MRVPSSAIAAANKQVMEMRSNAEMKRKSKRGHYNKYTSQQRAGIGQNASIHRIQAAKVKRSIKLEITINECTVGKFRDLYVKALKEQSNEQYLLLNYICRKEEGLYCWLGDRSDEMVKRYVANTRKVGGYNWNWSQGNSDES